MKPPRSKLRGLRGTLTLNLRAASLRGVAPYKRLKMVGAMRREFGLKQLLCAANRLWLAAEQAPM